MTIWLNKNDSDTGNLQKKKTSIYVSHRKKEKKKAIKLKKEKIIFHSSVIKKKLQILF